MSQIPACPQCAQENTYEDGTNFVCADCGHEWPQAAVVTEEDDEAVVKDANGTVLQTGDAVVLIKDLKVKGSSLVIKVGTKAKNIRIIEGDHDIDCKIDGIGAMQLKSEFVKKA